MEEDESDMLLIQSLYYLSEESVLSRLENGSHIHEPEYFIEIVYGFGAEKIISFLKEKKIITPKILTEILNERIRDILDIDNDIRLTVQKIEFYKRLIRDGAIISGKFKEQFEATKRGIQERIERYTLHVSLMDFLLK